ncbi:MAG: NUDIX domain-containing protein [Caldithrix sp.]|nr:NUDIX domain-containing protein [Caldithrix sp.]
MIKSGSSNISDTKTMAVLCYDRQLLVSHISSVLKERSPNSYIYKDVPATDAAVLIPLYFKDDQAYVLFTKRTEHLAHHKGQISFPGGKKDDADPSLMHTALRETQEEVGIEPSEIQLLGHSDIFLTNTHFMVQPFVGLFDYPYPFRINSDEIEHLIEVPLLHLLDEEIFEIKPYETKGQRWWIHYYYFGDEIIWGVTGFLVSNFLSIVFGIERNHF